MIELHELCGKHLLQGVEWIENGYAAAFLFKLDGITYRAEEDPDDGYRSMLGSLDVVEQSPRYSFNTDVLCYMADAGDDDILIMRDIGNGKVVLEPGTANTYDYYPYCVMEYHPENMSCNSQTKE